MATDLGLPAGFTLDEPAQASIQTDGLPQGFTLDQPPAEEPGSFVGELGRAAASQAGAFVKGAASLVALPADAVTALLNKAGITNWKPAGETIREAVDSVTPQPRNLTDRVTNAVVGSLGSGATGIGIGRAMMGAGAAAAPSSGTGVATTAPSINGRPIDMELSAAIGRALAQAPGAQGAGAVTGGGAAQLAAEAGAGPVGQLVAGVVGGGLSGAVRPTAGAAGRGAAAVAQPLTQGGREVIAGSALRSAATDAEAAITNLRRNPQEIVPGSPATTAEVAGDVGLADFQNRLRGLGDAKFGKVDSVRNEARQKLLDTIASGGESRAADRLRERRDKITDAFRERAYAEADGKPINSKAITDEVDRLIALPDNQGKSVQAALMSVREQLQGKNDIRSLYAVRKEINRVLEGKYVNSDESIMKYAGSQLGAVKGAIDSAITEVSPSWKPYLNKYAQLSRPIERIEAVADVRAKTGLSAPDLATGRDNLSQAKWKNAVTRSMDDLSQVMTKGQIAKLKMIGDDLDRGAAVGAANKIPGSTTAANLAASGRISVANIIGRALNKDVKELPPGMTPFAKPLAFIYSTPDEKIREMLVDAMLDPKLAEKLLEKGTPANVQSFVDEFAARAKGGATGGAEAGATEK